MDIVVSVLIAYGKGATRKKVENCEPTFYYCIRVVRSKILGEGWLWLHRQDLNLCFVYNFEKWNLLYLVTATGIS